MPYQRLPYLYDVLPDAPPRDPWLSTARWRGMENLFRELARRFGYREIRTPILEPAELFTRSIGEATDIVSKEMFLFTDRGGRLNALKPEGTAPVVRACMENGLFGEPALHKLYYIGQNFRYERGQKGRYRQHQQMGVEAFGSTDPALDAEVIALAMTFFTELGIPETTLHINSLGTPAERAEFRQALRDYVKPHLAAMSEEARMRFEVNPLRMLDTKAERDLQMLEGAPTLLDYLGAESRNLFEALQQMLGALGIPFVINTALVRGFDYYTHTVFEIKGSGLGAQDALGGGGRYDGLVQECGGPAMPGLGFGIGTERCLLALESLGIRGPEADEKPVAFVVLAGSTPELNQAAVQLLMKLRRAGIAADRDYQGKNMRRQMKRADDLGAQYLLILGEDELAAGIVQMKNQSSREQKTVAIGEVIEALMSEPRRE